MTAIIIAGALSVATLGACTWWGLRAVKHAPVQGRHHRPLPAEDERTVAWLAGLRPDATRIPVWFRAAIAALGALIRAIPQAQVIPDPNAHLARRWERDTGEFAALIEAGGE